LISLSPNDQIGSFRSGTNHDDGQSVGDRPIQIHPFLNQAMLVRVKLVDFAGES